MKASFRKFTVLLKKNPKYQIALVFVILLLGWFYWFQIRPVSIRSECAKVVLKGYSESFNAYDSDINSTGDTLNDDKIPTTLAENLLEKRDKNFEFCLEAKGIK